MSSLPQLTLEQARIHGIATRFRPLEALRAIQLSMRDPDDTAQAVRVIGTLAGKSSERLMRRFNGTLEGRQILAREQGLLDRLLDRQALLAMPEGSLGRVYVEWLIQEQISAEGLVEASEAASRGDAEAEGPYAVLTARMRDMHDLLHVTTGYGRDLVGEIGVLAFSFAQTKHSGVGFLIAAAYLRSFFTGSGPRGTDSWTARAVIREQCREGYRRGLEADWIVGADWENLLELPIDEVRKRFRIPVPPRYDELRSAKAPVLAA